MVKAALANGSRSTRAKVTRSQSLPGCGSTLPHTIVTQANGRRDGKRFIGRHVDLRRDIRLGCDSATNSPRLRSQMTYDQSRITKAQAFRELR